MPRKFDVVGLEMHSRTMWYHAHVKKALDFMEDNGFNALIFHQSDILNQIVYPKKYMNSRMMWEKFCGLRSFEIENNRLYVTNVIGEAAKRGIDFYFNLKEIFFTDEIIELFPDLVREKGVACPTDPFWWEYIGECIGDLCETVPGFKGVIFSCGTHECRTSVTKRNNCECERCRTTPNEDWYRDCIGAVAKALKAHGKELIVRDFSFTASNQSVILKGAKAADPNCVIALKNTPHDYYPTFPDNPKLGTTGQAEWAEFDAWGQFYGSGIFPASMAEDYKARLNHCYEKGVRGVFFRTDWEGMYENSCFSSANLLNLYAGGLLANDVDADLDIAYEKWGRQGWIKTLACDSDNPFPVPAANPEAWKSLRDFMKASWDVVRKVCYVRGHWFCEDNMFPDTIDKAWKMMVTVHGRDDWDPGASALVKPTPENMEIIFAEKEAALRECLALKDVLGAEKLGFPKEVLDDIDELMRLYELYCKIGYQSCRVVFLTQHAIDSALADDPVKRASAAVEDLRACREEVLAFFAARKVFYHHIIFWLLNEDRMRRLADDAAAFLDGTERQVISEFRRG